MKMLHNELRKDYLLNRWVVIATERARRPTDFAKPKPEPTKAATCPLCRGNEHMTPPATLVYLPENGGIRKETEEGDFRSKNWLIRCIPNMYPAFSLPQNPAEAAPVKASSNFGYAIGHHEVIVESPNHDDHPPDAPLPQLKLLIETYKDRLEAISKQPYVGYVQIFRNHGLEAGASLSHAHSQIIATPFVPSIPAEEMAVAKTYHQEHGSCIFCDLAKSEAQTPRLISEDGFFSVFAPYASVNPMEFWIVPKRHAPNLLGLTGEETEAFARTLKTALGALKSLVNDPPYNYGIHQAISRDGAGFYHWHLEVYPHLATWAGFEKSTGIYINTITPETAAGELRKAIQHA
jgi:UDPglucose--hexose-1-phosphate uridylyltransferase